MTICQDRHKICSSHRTHRIILSHYLCFKTFHWCLTKMAVLRGPTESFCVIVCTYSSFLFLCIFRLLPSLNLTYLTCLHVLLTYLIFTGTSIQIAPQPESYLFDFSSLTFNLPYFYRNFSPGWTVPSEFQKFQFSDSLF